MKTHSARTRPGNRTSPHPLWMRLLTVFCMMLLGTASTVQVCHSHDEAPGLGYSRGTLSHSSLESPRTTNAPDSAPSTAVNCPLCVAMHSALPVTHHLTQEALLLLEHNDAAPESVTRRILWRSDLTSRPPPAAAPIA